MSRRNTLLNVLIRAGVKYSPTNFCCSSPTALTCIRTETCPSADVASDCTMFFLVLCAFCSSNMEEGNIFDSPSAVMVVADNTSTCFGGTPAKSPTVSRSMFVNRSFVICPIKSVSRATVTILLDTSPKPSSR